MAKKMISASLDSLSDGVRLAMGADGNYSQSAGNTWEQIVSPVKIDKGHAGDAATPGFRAPSISSEKGGFGDESVSPTIHELDPYFAQIWGDGGTLHMDGVDFRAFNHDHAGDTSTTDFNEDKCNVDEDGVPVPGVRDSINLVRINAFRGPLIMSGWGFGMDDFPVPAKDGDMPDKAKFNPNLRGDRAYWKTGPVHLMWDDERQVWQGGYPIVCGVALGAILPATSVCEPSSFKIRILRNTGGADGSIRQGALADYYGGNANMGRLSDTFDETITVMNRDVSLDQEDVPNAVFVIAIKLNYEWLPLWVGCPEVPHCNCDDQPPVPPCIDFIDCPPDEPCAGHHDGPDIDFPTKTIDE